MTHITDDCWLFRRSGLGLFTFIYLLGYYGDSIAQVVLDGKFGTSGAVAGPNYSITPELGAVRGNNLFHSFTRFDLNYGESAAFSGPVNIQNVLARVTGGSASSINGTIRSEITGANFFFINPQGIVFGPNAKVDVSGSFGFSTADYLKLSDGARFVASLDAEDSVLSTAPVSSFGFISDTPASIVLQGAVLEAKENTSVSLIGGDITLQGASVLAPAGDINVASVRSIGEAEADLSTREGFRSSFPAQGDISLQEGAKLDASGEAGGRIVIRGGSLVVDNSRIEANSLGAGNGRGIDIAVAQDLDLLRAGQINSLTPAGLGASGDITISAEDIRINGDGLVDDFFNPAAQISTSTGDIFSGGDLAKAGDISIRARSLEVMNSAQVSSATFGSGDAGNIDIETSRVRLDALQVTSAQITANTQQIDGAGRAGNIRINTDHLEMFNGATILAASFGSGAPGSIEINAHSIDLLSGAFIVAGTFGSAAGGRIEINAQSLRIDGTDLLFGGPDLLTGIQAITTSTDFPASGGQIEIKAGSFELDHSATVFTSSFGAGQGGNIDINAGNLSLDSASTISATGDGSGSAGSISITGENVTLANLSAIRTSAPASSGGNITVVAGSEIRLVDSEINAQAGLDGGNITISAGDLIYLLNSTLTGQADSTGTGFGNGGNITIEPSTFLILNEGALISKSSLGNGGNISILSDYFFQSSSVIDATAPFGLSGTVVVSAPDVDLSGSLIALSGNLLDLDSQLRPDCAIRLSGDISTFILLGRGGLPIQPGGFLPSGILRSNEAR